MKRKLALSPYIDKIIEAYRRGQSVNKIAKEYRCDNSCIWRILQENGINKRPLILHEVKDEVITMYQNGYTMKEVATEFGSTWQSVHRLLKKFGIDRRSLSEACRTYAVDETFFEKIDTPVKSYWLGMLYADGNVMKAKGGFSIKLKANDLEILEKLKHEIGYQGPIRYENAGGNACLIIQSIALKEQIIKLGCVPAKSLILKFPTEEQVPTSLIRDFIRGYFDGDGGLSINKQHNQMIFSMVGTKDFCIDLQKVLKQEVDIDSRICITNKNRNQITHTLAFGGNLKVKKVLDYLYDGTEISLLYLERKRALFLKGLTNIAPRRKSSRDALAVV